MEQLDAEAAEFWEYSLRVYALPGVADVCISLQDDHGCDVNILLLCLWLAETRSSVFEVSDVEAIRRFVAAPNDNLVQPVRAVRRWVKLWSQDEIKAEPYASVYKALKDAELAGERLIQSRLIAALSEENLGGAATPQAAARASFENYRMVIGQVAKVSVDLDRLIVKALP
jgi:uncharacterized protein (TIGR02444 family)